MKYRVFATRPMPQAVLDFLAPHCDVQMQSEDAPVPPDDLERICREQKIEGLLVAGGRVPAELVRAAAQLRVVANCSVGYDNVDLEECTKRGILVTNTAGSLDDTTADLAFALLLAVARRLGEAEQFLRAGRWKHWRFSLLMGSDVHHKTLGIYGFGNIGRVMARRGAGFSMRILYHSRRRAPESVERELGAEYRDRESLIRESDFLSLHVPLTLETTHLIGERELAWMKPTAFLINTSRGQVVDEAALAAALKAGRLAGAGLDVFEHEPKVHPELLKIENNVVLLPHIGSATEETRTRMAMQAARNLLAALAGERPPNLINVDALRP
ncbi:MAG: 2-hydroxyacid dehydrogenase [Terriglobia bacterium]